MPASQTLRIGEIAQDLLIPGQNGKVLAVFSRSAYLVTGQEELVYLSSAEAPLHPRCLQLSGAFPRLTVGSLFSVDDSRLHIEPSFTLDLHQAVLWRADQVSTDNVEEIIDIPAKVKSIFTSLYYSQIKGFGRLIPQILLLAEEGPTSLQPATTDPILSLAWPAIREVAMACLTHQQAEILLKAGSLVGLGEGLTPSGDDFLGGMLYCIHHLKIVYPFLPVPPNRVAFVEGVKQRTNLISYSLLKDHAHGQALEPLVLFLTAILTARRYQDVHRSISRLTNLGHSTGWDLLTGALTGLLLTFNHPEISTH
ncbi:MAG: DUF2877 domain-containing protein [Anaerolineales bacterium]|nr:DUF2877 domain-containing protein [Anaerolineales bacterium]